MKPNQKFKVNGIAKPFYPIFSGQPSEKNEKYSCVPFSEDKTITTDTGYEIVVKKNGQDNEEFEKSLKETHFWLK